MKNYIATVEIIKHQSLWKRSQESEYHRIVKTESPDPSQCEYIHTLLFDTESEFHEMFKSILKTYDLPLVFSPLQIFSPGILSLYSIEGERPKFFTLPQLLSESSQYQTFLFSHYFIILEVKRVNENQPLISSESLLQPYISQ